MGKIDTSMIKPLFESKFMQSIFDQLFIVDLDSGYCQKFDIAGLTTLDTQSYDDWLISYAKKMYKPDAAEFFVKMDSKHICSFLSEQTSRYIVFCRIVETDCVEEYELTISYLDESQTQLIILGQKLSKNQPRPLETINELSRCNKRFQFIVNRLTENFIEVNVNTGACHMFPAENEMETRGTLKEQIAWWAENGIVPDEREAYIKEYELDNLLRCLRANNGRHSSTYTMILHDTRSSILINSMLIKESYGKTEEYIFAYAQDITMIKAQESRNKQLLDISQQLLSISQTEPLTGLFNRAACEKLISEHLAASNTAMPGVMLLIDIDHFKKFNDQYGHPTGDFVLKYLGKAMQDIFRSDDIVSRWGGDEFVVFMRDVYDHNIIKGRIERLRARLRQCKKDDRRLPITISVGGEIATPEISLNNLFDHCDQALYKIKSQGRDNYYICSY